MWKFKFPGYVSRVSVRAYGQTFTATKKLGFVSYWLIKWIHGEKKLEEMSATTYLNKELGGLG